VRYGLAVTSIVLIAFLLPLGFMAQSLTEERAIAAGRQDAQEVALFADDPVRLTATLADVNSGDRRTTVFTPSGEILGAAAAMSTSVELARTGRAFTANTSGGAEVLVPIAGAKGTTVVRTFVPDSQLRAGVYRAWAILLGVGLALLVVTALAGFRIAAGLSRSVSDLADVAQRLGAGELTARVEPSGPPEMVSVGNVLNDLGDQVGGLLADERELIADLSHRLRTPITALRLDTGLLNDPEERERMDADVAGLVTAVDTVIEAARSHRRRTGSLRCRTGRTRQGEVLVRTGRLPGPTLYGPDLRFRRSGGDRRHGARSRPRRDRGQHLQAHRGGHGTVLVRGRGQAIREGHGRGRRTWDARCRTCAARTLGHGIHRHRDGRGAPDR